MGFSQTYAITSHYIVTVIETEDSRYLHYPSEFVWSHTYGSPNIIDFNEQRYPDNIRYIALNESYVYFTGVTQTGGLKFIFGDRRIDISAAGVRYHVWIRFPRGSVKTADLYISYLEGSKRTRAGHCLESTDHTSRLKIPKYRLNWGPLNLMESFFVNRNLLNMAVHKEDFFPVDIHLQNKEHEKGIVKLTVDDITDIYTTLAFNKLVINNVRFKNTLIKGTPKQLSKYVFHSKVDDENIILITTKTLNNMFTIAYAFKNDGSFKQISLDNINYGTHHGLRIFKR